MDAPAQKQEFKVILQAVEPARASEAKREVGRAFDIDGDIAGDIVSAAPIAIVTGLSIGEALLCRRRLEALAGLGATLVITDTPVDDIPKVNWPETPGVARGSPAEMLEALPAELRSALAKAVPAPAAAPAAAAAPTATSAGREPAAAEGLRSGPGDTQRLDRSPLATGAGAGDASSFRCPACGEALGIFRSAAAAGKPLHPTPGPEKLAREVKSPKSFELAALDPLPLDLGSLPSSPPEAATKLPEPPAAPPERTGTQVFSVPTFDLEDLSSERPGAPARGGGVPGSATAKTSPPRAAFADEPPSTDRFERRAAEPEPKRTLEGPLSRAREQERESRRLRALTSPERPEAQATPATPATAAAGPGTAASPGAPRAALPAAPAAKPATPAPGPGPAARRGPERGSPPAVPPPPSLAPPPPPQLGSEDTEALDRLAIEALAEDSDILAPLETGPAPASAAGAPRPIDLGKTERMGLDQDLDLDLDLEGDTKRRERPGPERRPAPPAAPVPIPAALAAGAGAKGRGGRPPKESASEVDSFDIDEALALLDQDPAEAAEKPGLEMHAADLEAIDFSDLEAEVADLGPLDEEVGAKSPSASVPARGAASAAERRRTPSSDALMPLDPTEALEILQSSNVKPATKEDPFVRPPAEPVSDELQPLDPNEALALLFAQKPARPSEAPRPGARGGATDRPAPAAAKGKAGGPEGPSGTRLLKAFEDLPPRPGGGAAPAKAKPAGGASGAMPGAPAVRASLPTERPAFKGTAPGERPALKPAAAAPVPAKKPETQAARPAAPTGLRPAVPAAASAGDEKVHGLVLSKIAGDQKRQRAAEIIAEVAKVPKDEAMKLTERTIIPVLKGVTKDEAETALERFKKAKLSGRVTTRRLREDE